MVNSRTHRRRASVRRAPEDNGDSPSLVHLFLDHMTDRFAGAAMRRINHTVHEVVRGTILRLILAAVGTALLSGGAALLLTAGVKGLEALHCPLWLACLLTGIFTVIAGVVAIQGILWPREEPL